MLSLNLYHLKYVHVLEACIKIEFSIFQWNEIQYKWKSNQSNTHSFSRVSFFVFVLSNISYKPYFDCIIWNYDYHSMLKTKIRLYCIRSPANQYFVYNVWGQGRLRACLRACLLACLFARAGRNNRIISLCCGVLGKSQDVDVDVDLTFLNWMSQVSYFR